MTTIAGVALRSASCRQRPHRLNVRLSLQESIDTCAIAASGVLGGGSGLPDRMAGIIGDLSLRTIASNSPGGIGDNCGDHSQIVGRRLCIRDGIIAAMAPALTLPRLETDAIRINI